MTRAEVATELQVSNETVRRWEQGGSRPATRVLQAYLHVVGSDIVPAVAHAEVDEETSEVEIGDLLRTRRAMLGLTQAAAAARIGVAQATLAGWEIGRARPGRDVADAIATFLDEDVATVAHALQPRLTVEMANWPPLGRIIGERRLTLQLDRSELAARLRVAPRTIAAWEVGEKIPNNGHLDRLAEVLGIERAVLVSVLPERLPPTQLGSIIYRRQRLLCLSRDDIAAQTDVTPVTVSRWIWGHSAPVGSTVGLVADALQLDHRVVAAAIAADQAARTEP